MQRLRSSGIFRNKKASHLPKLDCKKFANIIVFASLAPRVAIYIFFTNGPQEINKALLYEYRNRTEKE
jgi:hypothetical protein